MLNQAFVKPHINYGLTIWASATKSNVKLIQNKKKKAIRTISFKKRKHPAARSFQELYLKINKATKLHALYENKQIMKLKCYIPSAKSDLMIITFMYQGPRL